MVVETVTMYRPTGPKELELVRTNRFRAWPPRLPEQPIFYLVTNRRYAEEITLKWNAPGLGKGFVTRFEVDKNFADRCEVKTVGARYHTEWWIPAEGLEELNRNIVGLIEVISEHDD